MSNYIDKAADLIREKGWIKNRNASPAGYCMGGALRHVIGQEHENYAEFAFHLFPARQALVAEIEAMGCPVGSVIFYNDVIAENVDEILHIMKLASERFENERV